MDSVTAAALAFDLVRPEERRKGRLVACFRAETLDSNRYQVAQRMQSPELYTELSRQKINKLLDFSSMYGITLVNMVAIFPDTRSNLDLNRLLFH